MRKQLIILLAAIFGLGFSLVSCTHTREAGVKEILTTPTGDTTVLYGTGEDEERADVDKDEEPEPEEPTYKVPIKITTDIEDEDLIETRYLKYNEGKLTMISLDPGMTLPGPIILREEFNYNDDRKPEEKITKKGYTLNDATTSQRVVFKYDGEKLVEMTSYDKNDMPQWKWTYEYDGNKQMGKKFLRDANNTKWIEKEGKNPVTFDDAGLPIKAEQQMSETKALIVKFLYRNGGGLSEMKRYLQEAIEVQEGGETVMKVEIPRIEKINVFYDDDGIVTHSLKERYIKDGSPEYECTVVKALRVDEDGNVLEEEVSEMDASCSGFENKDRKVIETRTWEYGWTSVEPTMIPTKMTYLIPDNTLFSVEHPEVLYGRWGI